MPNVNLINIGLTTSFWVNDFSCYFSNDTDLSLTISKVIYISLLFLHKITWHEINFDPKSLLFISNASDI